MLKANKNSSRCSLNGLRARCATVVCLFLSGSFLSCHPPPERAADRVMGERLLPHIVHDPHKAEDVGREALAKFGYIPIMHRARVAGWVTIKEIKRISGGDVVLMSTNIAQAAPASDFVEVFSEYAFAAGVVSQADSPLPGPGDAAAIGILVAGLIDAGLLDGALLASLGGLAGAVANSTTSSPPVAITMPMATTMPTEDAPPAPITQTETDREKKERCKKAKDMCLAACTRKLPTTDFGFQFWNCVNECMADEGCLGY